MADEELIEQIVEAGQRPEVLTDAEMFKILDALQRGTGLPKNRISRAHQHVVMRWALRAAVDHALLEGVLQGRVDLRVDGRGRIQVKVREEQTDDEQRHP